jgi:hypothetical protein
MVRHFTRQSLGPRDVDSGAVFLCGHEGSREATKLTWYPRRTRAFLSPQNGYLVFETLNDPVDVLASFVDGKLEPLRFRWRGRAVRVKKVTGRWVRREGAHQLRYFSVESPTADAPLQSSLYGELRAHS